MILHEQKLFFLHIPKCAGTSVEHFFGISPFNWKTPNYNNAVGWCPVNSFHMQHATLSELLNYKLITLNQSVEYCSFTIVRNPVTRLISDYNWVMKDSFIRDSFYNFLKRRGKFKGILTNSRIPNYRGDHLRTQSEYLIHDNVLSVDYVLKFEKLNYDWNNFLIKQNIPLGKLSQLKKNQNNNKLKILNERCFEHIVNLYHKDFDNFDYSKKYIDYIK